MSAGEISLDLPTRAAANAELVHELNRNLAPRACIVSWSTSRAADHEASASAEAVLIVLELEGEFDFGAREVVRGFLMTLVTTNELVVVDLRRVLFVDSSFLHNLVLAARAATRHGSRLRVTLGPPGSGVRNAFEVSRVIDVLDCELG